jgi:hypothetical protein
MNKKNSQIPDFLMSLRGSKNHPKSLIFTQTTHEGPNLALKPSQSRSKAYRFALPVSKVNQKIDFRHSKAIKKCPKKHPNAIIHNPELIILLHSKKV